MGLSVDSTACLKAWAESLGGISYPLLSDFYPHGEVSEKFGVFRAEGYSERAIFVIDKKGIIQYIDIHNIDEQPDNDILLKVLVEIEPTKSGTKTSVPAPEATNVEKSYVIIYCTSWCPACRRARNYLDQNGIKYTEVDISRNREAAAKVRGWTGGYETTPTFDIHGTIIIDFDQTKLAKILGLK